MKHAVVSIALLLAAGCKSAADADEQAKSDCERHPYLDVKFVRNLEITRNDDLSVVPEGSLWAITGNDVAEGKVTTSDILIDGRATVGGLEFEGKWWLTFQQLQKQTVWVYPGTKIGLGDTRPNLMIKEFHEAPR